MNRAVILFYNRSSCGRFGPHDNVMSSII